jgi:hypothetical protein
VTSLHKDQISMLIKTNFTDLDNKGTWKSNAIPDKINILTQADAHASCF